MNFLTGFKCTCGSEEVIAVEPGEDEVREIFLLRAERPDKAWCLPCWQQRYASEAAA